MSSIDDLIIPISKIEGIAALFTGKDDLHLTHAEMYGVNWILCDIAKDLKKLEIDIQDEFHSKSKET